MIFYQTLCPFDAQAAKNFAKQLLFLVVSDIITPNVSYGGEIMDIHKGDVLTMKKPHPCGSDKMAVLRSGMDFKLRCCGCGREFMIARSKAEKNVRAIDSTNRETNNNTNR